MSPEIGSYVGHTIIYKEIGDGSLKQVGEVNSCAPFDEDGPCYVHIYKDMRQLFGLPDEPSCWFFEFRRTAWKWVKERLGTTWI